MAEEVMEAVNRAALTFSGLSFLLLRGWGEAAAWQENREVTEKSRRSSSTRASAGH